MEKLESKYKTLLRSQSAFQRAFDLFNNSNETNDTALKEEIVASIIKHFELYYETFVKYREIYLMAK